MQHCNIVVTRPEFGTMPHKAARKKEATEAEATCESGYKQSQEKTGLRRPVNICFDMTTATATNCFRSAEVSDTY